MASSQDVKESESENSPHLTKFEVSNVFPSKVCPDKSESGHVAVQLDLYKHARCGEIIQGTTFPKENIVPAYHGNGFVDAVTIAYNHHHHLIIRPDDIWQSIMVQFSFCINGRAEEFRDKFVNFKGKKELMVGGIGNINSISYRSLVTKMEAEIDKNLVDPEVRAWIMPNFSTTTKEDRVTAGVLFMAAMKKYFDFKFETMCGIPTVSLDGTVADYEEIHRRLDKFETYGLKDWRMMLKPILEQFIKAKSGYPNKDFWSRICHYTAGGSGPTYLSGWITAFCVFDIHGEKQGKYEVGKEWPLVDTNNIPPGIVEVDVTVDDNGTEYKTVMLAGSMAIEIGNGGYSLQPMSGWIIAFKNEELGEENLEDD